MSGRWSFPGCAISLHTRLAVTSAEAAIDAVEAGLGITLVPSCRIDPQRRVGRLVTLLDDAAPAPVPVSLIDSGQGG